MFLEFLSLWLDLALVLRIELPNLTRHTMLSLGGWKVVTILGCGGESSHAVKNLSESVSSPACLCRRPRVCDTTHACRLVACACISNRPSRSDSCLTSITVRKALLHVPSTDTEQKRYSCSSRCTAYTAIDQWLGKKPTLASNEHTKTNTVWAAATYTDGMMKHT